MSNVTSSSWSASSSSIGTTRTCNGRSFQLQQQHSSSRTADLSGAQAMLLRLRLIRVAFDTCYDKYLVWTHSQRDHVPNSHCVSSTLDQPMLQIHAPSRSELITMMIMPGQSDESGGTHEVRGLLGTQPSITRLDAAQQCHRDPGSCGISLQVMAIFREGQEVIELSALLCIRCQRLVDIKYGHCFHVGGDRRGRRRLNQTHHIRLSTG